jgi:hypothetical protein
MEHLGALGAGLHSLTVIDRVSAMFPSAASLIKDWPKQDRLWDNGK